MRNQSKKALLIFAVLPLLLGCGNASSSKESSDSSISEPPSSSSSEEPSSSSSSQASLLDPSLSWNASYTLDKTYDGKAVEDPKDTDYSSLSDGEISWVWNKGGTALESAPIQAGSYQLKLSIAATLVYLESSITKDFTIAKADWDLSFPEGYSPDKVYDGEPVEAPTLEDGILIEWFKDESKLDSAPSSAGFYNVRISKAGDDNHNEATKELSFVIQKAAGSISFPEGYAPSKTYDGKPVEAPAVGEGTIIEWSQGEAALTSAPSEVGEYTVTIRQEASANFTACQASLAFSITQAIGTIAFADAYDPSKTYDAMAVAAIGTTDYVTNSDGVVSASYYQGETMLEAAPTASGTYTLKLSVPETINVTAASVSKDFAISAYTTDVFFDQPGVTVTMEVSGDSSLTKGAAGEIVASGWWVNLLFSGAKVPVGATSMTLTMKAKTALTNAEYNYSYTGFSLGFGADLAIGTEYSDISLPLAANGCLIEKIGILAPNNPLTISKISFVVPQSNIPAGKTGIFTHLGTSYPDVSSSDFRGSAACTFYNSAADDALVFGGQWWDAVTVGGATGVAIPSGSTTMSIKIKASAAFTALYVFSGTPANFAYDEATGWALTTSYQEFDVALNSATMINSLGICTANNYVSILSITFK